jgi:23S rRNA (pseudouridine1915-N3)-methyltransferase
VRITLLAVGTRMPAWVDSAVAEYSKRLPPELRFEIRALPIANRSGGNTAQAMAREGKSIRDAMPRRDRLVALDVAGRALSTEQLAAHLSAWQMSGDNYSLVIGGPDGIEGSLLEKSNMRWSLSPLTLPHPLVRVVVVEQLYRAWTINAGHPYHRS